MANIVIVGMQWGDEGKGKVVDLCARGVRHVARAQGGNNAGHTVVVEGKEHRFHLVPSGVIYPEVTGYIGGGTVVDPGALLREMEGLECEGRLWISGYAQVVMPYHRRIDREQEERKGQEAVGTTGRGIGPCYADKVSRLGIRMAELVQPEVFTRKLKWVCGQKGEEGWEEIVEEYTSYAERLKPFVGPVEEMLAEANKKGERILFEGAQGALLDNTFGTYPFVTSSCTLSGGVFAGLGMGPMAAGRVLGVAKAYTTRVGSGPLPTEMGERIFPGHEEMREIGTATGRKRRIGWLDAYLLRHSALLNGIDSLALMKLDILDTLEEIKMCVGYRLRGKMVRAFPVLAEELEEVEPVYETFAGWKEPTSGVRLYNDLPTAAKKYIRFVEQYVEVPIALISVGPERQQTIWMDQIYE